jgi:predicted acetyltransferase
VDAVHRAAGQGRPGWITRDTEVLRARHLVDPPAWRRGGEPLRIVTVSAPSSQEPGDPAAAAVRGYALFRRTEKWENGRPRATVTVRELAAVDAAAAHRLWSFLLDLDLTVSVEAGMLPVDDALVQLLVDPRSVTSRLQDNVWVRLLDLPAALTSRRYAAPLDVALAVTDDRLPTNAGTWRLRTTSSDAGAHVAEVERTTASPDVTLDVRELGAAYLGGRSLAAMGTAGLAVEHTPGALIAASAAFRWPLAPVCTWGW